jgi:hypothetical protein
MNRLVALCTPDDLKDPDVSPPPRLCVSAALTPAQDEPEGFEAQELQFNTGGSVRCLLTSPLFFCFLGLKLRLPHAHA